MGVWAWLVPGASSSLPKKLPGLCPVLPPPPQGTRIVTPLQAVQQPGRSIFLSRGENELLSKAFLGSGAGHRSQPFKLPALLAEGLCAEALSPLSLGLAVLVGPWPSSGAVCSSPLAKPDVP